MGTPSDCRDCGLCCTGDAARHAPVTGADWADLEEGAPEGESPDRWVRWIENRAFMRMEGGRCAALELRDGRFTCSIYLRRPAVCRALARASSSCGTEIERKDDKVRLQLPLWELRRPLPPGRLPA